MVLKDWDDGVKYKVVMNREQMYSIWPADRENPLGWKEVGKVGEQQSCLDYNEEVWTDMRPQVLQEKIEEAAHKIILDAKR